MVVVCRILVVFGLRLLAAAHALAERLPLKGYTTTESLVNNRISRIVRDSRGFLWICTEYGLSRFIPQPDRLNALAFKRFHPLKTHIQKAQATAVSM